ncbi:gamma-glutamyltransferase family protein [Ideonella sp. A 288]|uniref:gamma-glutamyltransferase family protein n=1 Tax=Ideonella sp. A 288 TaxID=1962181 RepID=UPI001F23A7BD|nr:gamma-glutamyltransferase family protein [Ideonella sp. A 288]
MNPVTRRAHLSPAWWLLPLAVLAGCGGSDSDTVADNACLQVSATGQVYNPGTPGENGAPEIPTGFASKTAVTARSFMVVAANPLATKAGCDILKRGGTAVDAAVATQMVLNLVEPQSSGIGGGAFMLHYNAATKAVTAYDGRETAPAAATENYLRWISDTQQTTPLPNARASGRSIGTPGVLHMLDAAHKDGGKLAWKDLFAPAIQVADDGFKISPRMAASVAGSAANLTRDPDAKAYFLNADGSAKAAGTLQKSPAMAATLRAIADGGVNAFYTGAIAQDIVAKIGDTTGGITPGLTTMADLAAYRSKKREAICTSYRAHWVCGMPPPSSGGLAVAQALGVLETFDMAAQKPATMDVNGGKPTVLGVHLVAEAERLAYADRDKYVADTDFVPLPGNSPAAMVDKAYLRQRASLVSLTKSMGTAAPGNLGPTSFGLHGPSAENGTTQVTVVDAQGNVASMTTTIESGFGAFHMAKGGFLLNNQLTDFSAAPADATGAPIANRVAAGKRPRSSMAPTLVFRAAADGTRGDFAMATGSPGGATIIQYVAKTLVGVLDWGMNAQQATSMIDFGAANSPNTNVGSEHPNVDISANAANDALITGLRGLGHTVNTAAQSSGLGTIVRRSDGRGYDGGADPRREGVVLGDLFTP